MVAEAAAFALDDKRWGTGRAGSEEPRAPGWHQQETLRYLTVSSGLTSGEDGQ